MTYSLPRTATAPFCPSEVKGSVVVDANASSIKKFLRFAGPGLLVSVGYMDPGNWATDIEAGSRFGYGLLWVVVASSLAAMLLQTLAARLGIASGLDLAQLCRARYGPLGRTALWLLAETAIIATDLAEVLGCALAFHLLFGVPLLVGAGLTLFYTMVVLALQGHGLRDQRVNGKGMLGKHHLIGRRDKGTRHEFQNLDGAVGERDLIDVHAMLGGEGGLQCKAIAVRVAGKVVQASAGCGQRHFAGTEGIFIGGELNRIAHAVFALQLGYRLAGNIGLQFSDAGQGQIDDARRRFAEFRSAHVMALG